MISADEFAWHFERGQVIGWHAWDVMHGVVPPAAKPRRQFVENAVRRARARHAELRGAITFPALESVFQRDDVSVTRGRSSHLGSVFQFLGSACLILREPMPEGMLVPVALHELGHIRMHIFDRELFERRRLELAAPAAPIFTVHDQMEAEADLFRDLILARAANAKRWKEAA